MKRTPSQCMTLIAAALILSLGSVAHAGLLDKLKSAAEDTARKVASDVMNESGEEKSSEPSNNTTPSQTMTSSAPAAKSTTASVPATQSNAKQTSAPVKDIPVNAPDVDILGVRIGMTDQEARKILESQGYTFGGQKFASLIILSKSGSRELPGSRQLITETGRNGSGKSVTLVYSLPPNAARVISVSRRLNYSYTDSKTGPAMEKFMVALEEKYGSATVVPTSRAFGNRLHWIYDQNNSLIPYTPDPEVRHVLEPGNSYELLCGKDANAANSVLLKGPNLYKGTLIIDTRSEPAPDPLEKTTCNAVLTVSVETNSSGGVNSAGFSLAGFSYARDARNETYAYAFGEGKRDDHKAAEQVQQQDAPVL